MTVFVKTVSDLVALLLQALRLSVLLPAALFVGLNLAFIWPRFQQKQISQLIGSELDSFPLLIILFILILFIAYALSVANIPIIRLFEGYPWRSFWPGTRLQASNRRRVRFLQMQIARLDTEINFDLDKLEYQQTRASDESNSSDMKYLAKKEISYIQNSIQQKQMEKNLLIRELVFFYPHHEEWRILPTRLGCVLGAAEEFSGHMYGLDAVTFWPFLEPILSEKGYAPFVEREKAVLDFLLNMVILTIGFGVELVYVDFVLATLDPVRTGVTLLLTLIIAFGLYLLSIQGAVNWGDTIRTAFVLYRHHLRKSLGLSKPKDYYHERILWQQAGRFLFDHDPTPGKYIFDYSGLDESEAARSSPQEPG